MNKIFFTLILLLIPFSLAYTTPRKKVGLVLSGGGAKGVAHIGAIKVLEELDIPIDFFLIRTKYQAKKGRDRNVIDDLLPDIPF